MTFVDATILALLILIAVGVWGLVGRKRRSDRWFHERPFSDYDSYPVLDIIDRAERDSGVDLTWGARQMLIIPVLETLQDIGLPRELIIRRRGLRSIDWAEVDRSIRDIVQTIAEDPSPADRELGNRLRGSRSVIRAFFKRFCNIPPFCSRPDER
jgi:hypothetical protein